MLFRRHCLAIWIAMASAILADEPAAIESAGSDWPQFQGPRGIGASPETGLARNWPAGGPPVAWRVKIKQGWGCPSVVGDDVYLGWTEERRGTAETIVCLSASTGQEKWKFTYEIGPYWERNIGWGPGGFRSTPVVSGDWVFTLGAIGHLHCLNRHTGKVVWNTNLWQEWNPSGEKGYCFSPLVEDGALLLWYSDGSSEVSTPDKREVLCRALDAATGKERWRFREPHREPSRMGEGQTPAITTFAGEKCLLGTANCELIALRISDGKPVWRFECIKREARGTTIPTPLVLDRLIVNIPDNDAAHVVAVDRSHPVTDTVSGTPSFPASIVWKVDLNTYCTIHQFRHRDGFLYGFVGEIRGGDEKVASESQLNLVCLELLTGKIRWSASGFQNGISLIEADGLLFVRSYQTLRLVEATPEGFRVRGEVKTHDVWKATVNLTDLVMPVLSRGRLFVRTPEELICYRVR